VGAENLTLRVIVQQMLARFSPKPPSLKSDGLILSEGKDAKTGITITRAQAGRHLKQETRARANQMSSS
jgi:hypothetical protein